jgi:hypothetical protein
VLLAAACALLTSAEIAKVQGEAPKQAKESESGASQRCFYELPTFTRSISLEVTRGAKVRELWKKSISSDQEEARPERVRGIGDDAFWFGDPRLGGLYVLRRDAMLRLSVGGAETKGVKLRKLERLARYALKRLFR